MYAILFVLTEVEQEVFKLTINELRKEKELTVAELADKLEISGAYAVVLCYGKRKITMPLLRKIKGVYPEVDTNKLIEEGD